MKKQINWAIERDYFTANNFQQDLLTSHNIIQKKFDQS